MSSTCAGDRGLVLVSASAVGCLVELFDAGAFGALSESRAMTRGTMIASPIRPQTVNHRPILILVDIRRPPVCHVGA